MVFMFLAWFLWFHGFIGFSWFQFGFYGFSCLQVVFFMVFQGSRFIFHVFLCFQFDFPCLQVEFLLFSMVLSCFLWFIMVLGRFYGFRGSWLVFHFHVENILKLCFGPTIQSRPCRPKASFGLVQFKLLFNSKLTQVYQLKR